MVGACDVFEVQTKACKVASNITAALLATVGNTLAVQMCSPKGRSLHDRTKSSSR